MGTGIKERGTWAFPVPAFMGNQGISPILVVSEATMYDDGPIIAIMDVMWNEGNGVVPTNKLVRAAMRNVAGSNRNVAKIVKKWKEEHGLSGSQPAAGTPIANGTRKAGSEAAVSEATIDQAWFVTLDDVAQLTEQMRIMADKLMSLEDRVRNLEGDDDLLLKRVSAAHWRARTADLWERVLTTVAGILQEHAHLTWHDIFEMLPPDLCQEAARLHQPLNLDTLAKRLNLPLDSDLRRHPEDDE